MLPGWDFTADSAGALKQTPYQHPTPDAQKGQVGKGTSAWGECGPLQLHASRLAANLAVKAKAFPPSPGGKPWQSSWGNAPCFHISKDFPGALSHITGYLDVPGRQLSWAW